MKRLLLFIWILFVVSALPDRASAQATDSVIIRIQVNTGLQFDVVRFRVKPGAKVKIVFENTDDMDHNFLITKPGAREEIVMAALKLGEKGPAMDYIPKSEKILWSIPVISPHQERSVSFTAPQQNGVFPYVCTYPGHGFLMYGAMYVTNDVALPDITKDENIPPARRVAEVKPDAAKKAGNAHAGHQMPAKPLHPYTPVPPYLYRVFIDGSSPAAIAVSLPKSLSYCFDAGTSRMRFAWKGGFLDNSELWKGKGDVLAKVIGGIFFRDKTTYPLRLKDSAKIPEVDFKGYKLINRYPEFHYTINGKEVFELITPKEDGSGLIRNFRIPKAGNNIWFIAEEDAQVKLESSAGKWEKGKLMLSASEAKNFSITMTIKRTEASL